jgi:DNA-binding NarL/FixJ family response regulator
MVDVASICHSFAQLVNLQQTSPPRESWKIGSPNNLEVTVAPLENLTLDEMQLVNRLFSGESEAQIAQELNLSQSSVRRHIDSVFKKTGVCSPIELLLYLYSEAQNIPSESKKVA